MSTRTRKMTKRREELLGQVMVLGRDLGAYTVMMHTAVAQAVGLNATDHKSLDLLSRHGPMTAGALAEVTGLTSGAVTGVVDRLEKAGFVERRPDPDDRRRVIVAARPGIEQAYGDIFDSLGASTMALAERYSDDELAVITDWVARTIELIMVETTKIRDHTF